MILEVSGELAMKEWGAQLGALLCGSEVIELIGDVGAGKTTLAKGIAAGMGIDETIQSPTFTISRVYDAPDDRRLVHYDFYRLADAGIMASELHETINEPNTVTIIEWAGIVEGVLPVDRLSLHITSPTESSRRIVIQANGPRGQQLLEQLT